MDNRIHHWFPPLSSFLAVLSSCDVVGFFGSRYDMSRAGGGEGEAEKAHGPLEPSPLRHAGRSTYGFLQALRGGTTPTWPTEALSAHPRPSTPPPPLPGLRLPEAIVPDLRLTMIKNPDISHACQFAHHPGSFVLCGRK